MDFQKFPVWSTVKAVSTLALVTVFCVKAYEMPLTLTVDFQTLLSLLLAIFAIALSALFYFKATESSNAFYDNTYKFTRDIAQLLAKIESGFGERLRHLDEGYSSMRSYLESRSPDSSGVNTSITKKRIENEKAEFNRVIEQRNKIVREFIDRSQLQDKEKREFEIKLKQKEAELVATQDALTKLRKQQLFERLRRQRSRSQSPGMDRFSKSQVIERMGSEFVRAGASISVQHSFDRLAGDLPKGYIEDLERHGYYEGGLTRSGAQYLIFFGA